MYFHLIILILSTQTLGQNLPTTNVSHRECASGPIIWSNCQMPGNQQGIGIHAGKEIGGVLYGEWKSQKDFMYDLYDQMKQMMRRIEALEDNMKYDYHYDSNSYSDNWIWQMEIVCNKSWKYINAYYLLLLQNTT